MTQIGTNDLVNFVADTPAVVTDVNGNFTAIKNAHNNTDSRVATLEQEVSNYVGINDSNIFSVVQKYPKLTITGATNATPIVITSEGHPLSTGDRVLIVDVGGNTASNEVWTVTDTGTDTFSLNDSVGNGAYTSGGYVYLLPKSLEDFANKAYLDNIIATQSKIIPFGTVTTGTKTMTVNRNHTANFTGASTLAVPTITTTNEFAWCYIEFTTSNASYPTRPTVKWDNDYNPTFSTTKTNCVFFYTMDNGTTWKAKYCWQGA